ncbi:MAG: Lrp/AsnC ligand binding domain-containing protein [Candidatus Caldarchaeales archaeon]
MPIHAYVFIRVVKGNANAVLKGVSRISGVRSARIVTGRYDIVAFVEADSLEGLGRLVATKIHRVRGVQSTETAVVTI